MPSRVCVLLVGACLALVGARAPGRQHAGGSPDGTGWREIDPTNGTPSVDARHIEASVADVLSLLSLAQIRIASVE